MKRVGVIGMALGLTLVLAGCAGASAQSGASGASSQTTTGSQTATPSAPQLMAVPVVIGQSRDAAIATLNAADLNVTVESGHSDRPKGEVISQSPTGGNVAPGAMVSIQVSSGPALVRVPNLHGKMYDVAERKLKNAGLKYKEKVNAEYLGPAGDVGVAEVYKQRPRAGSLVPKGTAVTIYFQIYE